jgi:CRISPR-associated endonuclease/helicase Cas3
MLLQRLGRFWRHKRENRPVDAPCICIIEEDSSIEELQQMSPKAIREALGGKANVYAPYVLLRSLKVWKEQTEVALPSQIRMLLESTYEDRDDEPQGWSDLSNEWYKTDSSKKMKAQMSSNYWQPPLDDQKGIQTRLNELKTVTMVLCRAITKKSVTFIDATTAELGGNLFRFATAKGIHKNLVKVPLHHFVRVELCPEFTEYIHEIQCAGIVNADGSVSVKGLKEEVRLFYSDELGLLVEKTSEKERV